MFQAADAVVEYGMLHDKQIYLVQDLLKLKTQSEADLLKANQVFNFLFKSHKAELITYAGSEDMVLEEFSLINDLILCLFKRKYTHVL